jgi:hypothetical protein
MRLILSASDSSSLSSHECTYRLGSGRAQGHCWDGVSKVRGEGSASGRFAFSNPTEDIKIPYDPTLSQCSRSQDLATILDTIVTDCMALCREQSAVVWTRLAAQRGDFSRAVSCLGPSRYLHSLSNHSARAVRPKPSQVLPANKKSTSHNDTLSSTLYSSAVISRDTTKSPTPRRGTWLESSSTRVRSTVRKSPTCQSLTADAAMFSTLGAVPRNLHGKWHA